MATVDPQSTTFQRSEAWRLATQKGTLRWRQQWLPYERDFRQPEAGGDRLGGRQLHQPRRRRLGGAGEGLAAQCPGRGARRPAAAAPAGAAQLAPQPAGRPPKIVGGSTITQQLAKNLLLSGERTLLRKGQEMVLTFALERMLSKERILEIYLNSVEWGEGVFGAEAAARHYYRKSAAQLTRLRSGAPGGHAAASQVLREGAELRLPGQPRFDHRRAHARMRSCRDDSAQWPATKDIGQRRAA